MTRKLFPTSVVGSMPRPAFVRDLIMADPPLEAAEFKSKMDSAIRYVVALQEQAGLDVITDGEWRRKSYIGVIAELAEGFELGVNESDGRPWTTVVGKLSPKKPGFIAEEVRFLKSISDRLIKATLPAPALLGERMWDPEMSKDAYPTREEFVRDCVPILRREVEFLIEAGSDIIQIDDPHLCLFVDEEVRAKYEDPVGAMDFSVEMVNAVVEGFDRARFALHLCRRAGARVRGEKRHAGGYGPILEHLNRLDYGHLTMEFSTPEAGDCDVFKDLRDDFEIGLGSVGVTPGQVDSAEEIASRVRRVAEHVDPKRIVLNPDCGFAPGSGAVVSLDETYEKLKQEVLAGKILREEFGD
ncbi:MAG: cobalamin-independent methionine synthase II family protein [Candidatus Omnitrophica bacterium]|nr:cobalamin-independent methionine synthase II family protein [Candidatus Omnitrophota bacterium]